MIPFNKPHIVGKELEYIEQAIANLHLSGDGLFSRKCQSLLEQELNVPKALLTTSCTDALEMAALLLEVEPGDEVIVPAFTFPSTINAFVLRGARPVFIDIRADTLNLDETRLEPLITPRTKAIVAVHYAGVGCEMQAILKVAATHGIPVVEDNAHGLFGKYEQQPLGTFGCLATLSFHETKNVICGEGGALLINDPEYIERAEIIREKGTDRNRFFRGQVDKYTWIDVGSSFLLSDILAAFLYAQLEARASIQARRERIWNYYQANLLDWAASREVRLPFVPQNCEQPYHMFYLIMNSPADRTALLAHLRERDIGAIFHYQALDQSRMGQRLSGQTCPVAEAISNQVVRLPFYNDLTEAEQSQVIEALQNWEPGR
ncbi:MAG TPA: dTDP-4-amino-4,6-dideoxygalactose transaminase [Pyrinomonadaceae bacterium]|nr:dTDP-4-amino-4,6-dideoxygalactose transaminase [Pyrinomonadaceae bacterium]